MKKILLFSSIILALGITTNSCISEKVNEIVPDPGPGPDPDPSLATKKTFYLRFLPDQAMADVSTYAGPSLGGANPILSWGDLESTGVFMTGSDNTSLFSNRKYEFTSSSSIYTDTITTALKTATAYGYTPYQSSVSGTTVSYTLDNIQNQSADNSVEYYMDESLGKNVFTISSVSNPYNLDGGVCPLTYKSIFAFLRFQVTKSSLFTTFTLQKIKSVKLYIADESEIKNPLNYTLAGSYNIDVSKAPGTSGYMGPSFSSSVNNLTASVTGGNDISEYLANSPYVWFVVNPIAIKSTERLVSVVETGMGKNVDYKIISQHSIPTLEASTIYTLRIEANTDNTVSDKFVTTYFSNNQASNCYIIPRAGVCQIPLKRVSGDDLRGYSVDWLWASKENGGLGFDISELIDPSSIVYDESAGCIRFRVGTDFGKYTKGNVILALKNTSNQIIWTWHIWITDEPQGIKYEGNKIFLDRNIGALSANMVSTGIDNYGFVYQWGRKDPFFGGDGMTNETAANMLSVARNNTIVNTGASWSVNTTTGTIDMATKNPMKFICNTSSSKDKPADWLSGSNPTLWSDTQKTDYDPCPYGYKVPGKNDLSPLHKAAQTSLIYFSYQGHRYWDYRYYDGGAITAWPAAGMRLGRNSFNGNNGAQLLYSGTDANKGQCFYWTSSPINIGGNTLSGGSHRIYTSGSTLYSEDDFGDNADAYPVRCVKMVNP